MFPENTNIIVRADLNVPLIDNNPVNLFRFASFLPTLNLLLQNNNKIIIITHLGKPDVFTLAPSTNILLPIFKSHGYTIQFAKTVHEASFFHNDQIILLENLRFMPQEMTNDLFFAQKIKKLGHYFVQDAFASLDSNNCSITTLPSLFHYSEKSLGLLVQKEITQLDRFSVSHQSQVTYLLSGGKIKKIKYIKKLLDKKTIILLGPALCIPFLCLHYHKNNCCIIDKKILDLCDEIQKHPLFQTHIILPIDLLIKREDKQLIISAQTIRSSDFIISIGEKTINIFEQKIKESDIMIINGYMGFIENAYCIEIMKDLLKTAFQKEKCLIGGGDTIFFVDSFMQPPLSTLRSTGGGAMLAYLANNTLIGLESFIKKADTEIKNSNH